MGVALVIYGNVETLGYKMLHNGDKANEPSWYEYWGGNVVIEGSTPSALTTAIVLEF